MNLVSEMIGFLLSYSQNNAHVLYWAIFAHLHCKLWTGDVLASGDKLPSDHTSKTDVRGQCDNSPTKASSSWGHRGWRDIKPKRSNVFLGHFFSQKRREKIFCCLLRSVRVRGSVPVHMVRTGCSYRTAVTVSRIEQMSPLKAFFFDTHGLYYHHEIKLKTCPFRHHNDRVILGRWAWTKCVQYCVLQNRSA